MFFKQENVVTSDGLDNSMNIPFDIWSYNEIHKYHISHNDLSTTTYSTAYT